MSDDSLPQSEFILYQTEDGRTRIQCRFENETVWLNQSQMAELFQTTQQNVSLHVRNIYEEGELDHGATHKEFLSVRQEGARSVQRKVEFYNLDVIISVGYRVKSLQGTQFRIWATQRLREYIQCRFENDTLWLTQAQIAELFQTTPQNVTLHLKAIFAEGELPELATCKDYLQVCQEGGREVSRKLRQWAILRLMHPGLEAVA